MKLDKFIKAVLAAKGVKQVELAEKLGTNKTALGGLITRNKMGVDKLETIANTLNCNVDITFTDKTTGQKWSLNQIVGNEETDD